MMSARTALTAWPEAACNAVDTTQLPTKLKLLATRSRSRSRPPNVALPPDHRHSAVYLTQIHTLSSNTTQLLSDAEMVRESKVVSLHSDALPKTARDRS